MAQENFLAPSMLHEFAKDDVKLGFRFGTLNNLKKKHFKYKMGTDSRSRRPSFCF